MKQLLKYNNPATGNSRLRWSEAAGNQSILIIALIFD
jgi:hypothetical protein